MNCRSTISNTFQTYYSRIDIAYIDYCALVGQTSTHLHLGGNTKHAVHVDCHGLCNVTPSHHAPSRNTASLHTMPDSTPCSKLGGAHCETHQRECTDHPKPGRSVFMLWAYACRERACLHACVCDACVLDMYWLLERLFVYLCVCIIKSTDVCASVCVCVCVLLTQMIKTPEHVCICLLFVNVYDLLC